MTLNYIWIGFFLIAFLMALGSWIFSGNTEVFKAIMDSTFSSSKMAVMDIALPLAGVMTLWLGLMNIGEKAGAIRFLSRIVGPFFNRLFPEIPENHPASGQVMMNFSANMLGLDNAATPLGLKAMQSLQDLNPKKDTASNAQIMFLVLNTSGLTIVPVSILAQRAILGAANPTDVFIPIMLATYVATLVGLIALSIKQKISLWNKTVALWLGGVTALVALIVLYFASLSKEEMEVASSLWSNLILLSIVVTFIGGGLIRKINVYEAFIEGAKNGFETSVRIIPYLVGMLVGIAVFRASGALDVITGGIAWCVNAVGGNTDFVSALPTAFMKPLSGSGARAMMIETMTTYGADSFAGRLSCLFQGATDTTFYIVALYFGSVGIKKTRYAVGYGLLADFSGVLAAIAIAYLFYS
ncbi:MAG: nucleoside recognition domain-containing protein [Bacteroidales bacterium]|nr:nucleoside recognition domain-containing protein [Bacteroidales bacterium]